VLLRANLPDRAPAMTSTAVEDNAPARLRQAVKRRGRVDSAPDIPHDFNHAIKTRWPLVRRKSPIDS
jgi:hypothetical protein